MLIKVICRHLLNNDLSCAFFTKLARKYTLHTSVIDNFMVKEKYLSICFKYSTKRRLINSYSFNLVTISRGV